MTERTGKSSASGGGPLLPIMLLVLDLNIVFLWPLLEPVLPGSALVLVPVVAQSVGAQGPAQLVGQARPEVPPQ